MSSSTKADAVVIAAGVVTGVIAFWVWQQRPWWWTLLAYVFGVGCGAVIAGALLFGDRGTFLSFIDTFIDAAVTSFVVPIFVIITCFLVTIGREGGRD